MGQSVFHGSKERYIDPRQRQKNLMLQELSVIFLLSTLAIAAYRCIRPAAITVGVSLGVAHDRADSFFGRRHRVYGNKA